MLAVAALTGSSLCNTRRQSRGPSHHRRFCCPHGSSGTTTPSDSLPASRPLPGSSPVIGRLAPAPLRSVPGRGGPLLFPPSPSTRSTSPTPGGSSRLHIQALHLFHGLHPEAPGSAPPCSHLSIGTRTTRQTSLHAADRVVAPPVGLSTSGFDPDRFQPEPPTCYRASWQLPGPDSHRLATTSMSPDWSRHRVPNPSSSGRTAIRAYPERQA